MMDERTGDWLTIGGGAAMLLAFAPGWSSYGGARGDNPFHYPLTGGVAWLLVIAVGAITALRDRGIEVPAPVIKALPGAALLALVLMLLCVVGGGRDVALDDGIAVTVGRGPGMWLGLLASAVTAAGTTLHAVSKARSEGTPPDDE